MQYAYKTENTCAQMITFDIDGDVVTNIEFHGGCNGNLKAISKLVDSHNYERKGAVCPQNMSIRPVWVPSPPAIFRFQKNICVKAEGFSCQPIKEL